MDCVSTPARDRAWRRALLTAATAGDLGYTYGTYALGGTQASHGFYVRVWSRGRDGVWRVTLDVLQPV
jgi:hypothetical protein